LTIWHCILSAELIKNALLQIVFLAILPTEKSILYDDGGLKQKNFRA